MLSPRLPLRVSRLPLLLRSASARLSSSATYPRSSSLITLTDIPAPTPGRIRILSLNRPSARNALSRQLVSELSAHISHIAAEYTADGAEEVAAQPRFGGAAGVDQRGPTRALVIDSDVDSCFCAGADLKERAGFSREETQAFLTHLRSTFHALSALPIPTISAISSTALGGGLELALATHFRVLASTAVLALPETKLGIIPGAGATYRLPALIGLARARDLILTGRRVRGPEAYFLGLADRLVEIPPQQEDEEKMKNPAPEDNDEAKKADTLRRAADLTRREAISLAWDICTGGPAAVRAALRAVAWAREEVESECYERVLGTADRDEALRAFEEKRRPEFKGK